MAVGASIRSLFGSQERRIADLYRAIFFDLDCYADFLKQSAGCPFSILEVGCGEGAVTERLALLFPAARITAIDITERLGRLYAGRREGVEFRHVKVEQLAGEAPGRFDIVLLSDVLHHVPLPSRSAVLGAIRGLLAPGGIFVLKEWERTGTPIHGLCYASDRWLTGDRISYMTEQELRRTLGEGFGPNRVVATRRIRPWRNNLAMIVQPEPAWPTAH